MEPKLTALGESLGLESAREELERLHAMAASEGFWNDAANSQKVTKQTRLLETKIASFEKMCADREDMLVLCEMAIEEDDDSMLPELEEGYAALEQEMEEARLETLLTGEYDGNNATHDASMPVQAEPRPRTGARCSTGCTPAGQSATASQYKILDYLDGDEAGIKSRPRFSSRARTPTAILKGGKRCAPSGARVSLRRQRPAPDLLCRRWRSCPRSDDDANDVEIRPEDIEMQVYRSSGAGGQHINKTSSAVRIDP